MGKLGQFLAWTIVPLLLIGSALRIFLFEPWTVPRDKWIAASVGPSLSGGDLVLLLTRGTPGFGDLVRCADPEKSGSFVIGRIVGTQGDVVEIGGSQLRVNGKAYNSTDACDKATFPIVSPETEQTIDLKCGRVEMAGGWHFIGRSPRPPKATAPRKFKVETARVFLISDNRDIHDDSRDFGALPVDTCDRRIVFRLWSAKGWMDSGPRMTLIR
jgi:signal peptidase I